jgi:3-hydroxymyristoyl/3-hydroxydecanoyl-(acyl carrier protein) dehydratase
LSVPENLGNPAIFLLGLDKVRFRKPVVPGDQLMMELTVLRGGKKIFKMQGQAFVNQTLVTEAEIMASVGVGGD